MAKYCHIFCYRKQNKFQSASNPVMIYTCYNDRCWPCHIRLVTSVQIPIWPSYCCCHWSIQSCLLRGLRSHALEICTLNLMAAVASFQQKIGGSTPPLPSAPLSLPSFPLPSHFLPSPSSPFSSLPSPPALKVAPLNPANGSGGAL